MTDYTRITRRGLAQELGSSLGEESAWESVSSACRELEMDQWVLNLEDTQQILGLLRRQHGLVGIAARSLALKVAKSESRKSKQSHPAGHVSLTHLPAAVHIRSTEVPTGGKNPSAPISLRATDKSPEQALTLPMLTEMLGSRIGQEDARPLVDEASQDLELGPKGELTRKQAEQILDRLKRHSGLVGVSAHFLSTRLLMLTGR